VKSRWSELAGRAKTKIFDFNPKQHENLISTLLNGTCIFIGAGVSKLAGYPLWKELKARMVDYFWSHKDKIPLDKRNNLDLSMCESLKNHDNNIEIFDYLYSVENNLFISGVKYIFNSAEKQSNNRIFEALNKLNNSKNFFVTTNIDRGLEQYLGISSGLEQYLGISKDDIYINPKFNVQPKLITYLHGRVDDSETWIFTTAQYSEGYNSDNAPCIKYLKDIFEKYNVLFIGYGLEEKEILRAIQLTNERKILNERKIHYWLEASRRKNSDFLKIRSTNLKYNYNIDLIPYDIDQNGYESLYDVISTLYKAMCEKEGGI